MSEFDHIGTHCAMELCHQHDFLPFQCQYCQLNYCSHHRQPNDHHCTAIHNNPIAVSIPHSETTTASTSSSLTASVLPTYNPCTYTSCSNKEIVPFLCPFCSYIFCLQHRDAAYHQCKNLISKESSVTKSTNSRPVPISSTTDLAPTTTVTSSSTSSSSTSSSSVTTTSKKSLPLKLRLMKTKTKIPADPKIPLENRYFLEIIYLSTLQPPNLSISSTTNSTNILYICTNIVYTIGKLIDILSIKYHIINNNNNLTNDPNKRLSIWIAPESLIDNTTSSITFNNAGNSDAIPSPLSTSTSMNSTSSSSTLVNTLSQLSNTSYTLWEELPVSTTIKELEKSGKLLNGCTIYFVQGL